MSGPIRSARYWCPASLGCTPSDPINSGFVANQPSAMGSTNTAPTAVLHRGECRVFAQSRRAGWGSVPQVRSPATWLRVRRPWSWRRCRGRPKPARLGMRRSRCCCRRTPPTHPRGSRARLLSHRRRYRCCQDGRNRSHPHRRVSEERSRRWTSGWGQTRAGHPV